MLLSVCRLEQPFSCSGFIRIKDSLYSNKHIEYDEKENHAQEERQLRLCYIRRSEG